jgi:hypothetical protein
MAKQKKHFSIFQVFNRKSDVKYSLPERLIQRRENNENIISRTLEVFHIFYFLTNSNTSYTDSIPSHRNL